MGMGQTFLAIALAVSLGYTSAGWAQSGAENAGCENIRQYWTDLQSGNHLVGAVTASDVSAGTLAGATPLNTASWILYVPAVSIKWPNSTMQIDISTPAVPTVECRGSTLAVTTTVHLAFSVFPSGGGQQAAFTLAVPFSYDAAFRFDSNHPFRWTTAGLPMSIVSTSVGPIDLSLLQGLNLRPYLGLAHM